MGLHKKRDWIFGSAWFTMCAYCCALSGDTTIGLIGGQNSNGFVPMGALVTSSGSVTNLNLSTIATAGLINSVALNLSGTGLVGGRDFTTTEPPLAALISSSGVVTKLNLSSLTADGSILSVALNTSGTGLIGGGDLSGSAFPIAAFISPSGVVTKIDLSSVTTKGSVFGVALNDSGTGLIGGEDNNTAQPPIPMAALISSSGSVTKLNLSSLTTKGFINSVALNASGTGLIAGEDENNSQPPIAALISPSGVVTKLDLSSLTTDGDIFNVALNASGMGLIGGQSNNGAQPPIAALISPSGSVTNLSLTSLSTAGFISSVALNSSGTGLIGGIDNSSTNPIAALISSSGVVTKLDLSSLATNGIIRSVSLNDLGAGLIGGQNNGTSQPLAALVSSSGVVTKLDLSSLTNNGVIFSVAQLPALLPMLSNIPNSSLSGNNLILANYINTNASYDAFYFVPSVLNNTLSQALESAAPTRNAFSVFAADNNLFFLNTSFSSHSQISRQVRRMSIGPTQALADNRSSRAFEDNLVAENSNQLRKQKPLPRDERPYEIWADVFGAVAYQKAQHQTPGFEPMSGGVILAFDGKATTNGRFGVGAAYTFTHLHEKQSAGHSNINQEYLFLYGLWDDCRFYFDGAVWGGLFQIENVRKIQMTSFSFQSKSHPKGWQLAPHAEFGYDKKWSRLTLEPFVMLDWVNNWQRRYQESGSGPFNYSQKKHYSSFLRSELGFRFYETITFSSWQLGFKEKGSYVNKKPFKVGTVTASLVGAPGSFTVETLTTTQNLGVGELEILFEPMDSKYPYGTIGYQGEFGSKYQSHQVSVGLNWNF